MIIIKIVAINNSVRVQPRRHVKVKTIHEFVYKFKRYLFLQAIQLWIVVTEGKKKKKHKKTGALNWQPSANYLLKHITFIICDMHISNLRCIVRVMIFQSTIL